jgi:hypothetical protein
MATWLSPTTGWRGLASTNARPLEDRATTRGRRPRASPRARRDRVRALRGAVIDTSSKQVALQPRPPRRVHRAAWRARA